MGYVECPPISRHELIFGLGAGGMFGQAQREDLEVSGLGAAGWVSLGYSLFVTDRLLLGLHATLSKELTRSLNESTDQGPVSGGLGLTLGWRF